MLLLRSGCEGLRGRMLLLRRGCEGLRATPGEPLEDRRTLKYYRRSREAQKGLWGSRGRQPPPSIFLPQDHLHLLAHRPITGLGQRDP